jgi:hypothetical protein
MSNSNSSTKFEKTKFRPWNNSLQGSLKDNFSTDELFTDSFSSFGNNLDILVNDLDLSLTEPAPSFSLSSDLEESELMSLCLDSDEEISSNFSPTTNNTKTNESAAANIDEDLEVKNRLRQAARDRTKLSKQLETETKSLVSFGGFIQAPQSSGLNERNNNSEKIRNLKNDLQSKEQEIYALTANLKISQAIERSEQADKARLHEIEARKKAEARMGQAIEQANIAVQRLHEVIEKFDLAQEAQKEEEKLRRIAESKIEEANTRAAAAEVNLRAENHAKVTAETKAQTSINQTIQIELAKQQLEEQLYQVKKQLELTEAKLHDTELAKNHEEKLRKEMERDFSEVKKLYADASDELKKTSEKLLNIEYLARQLEDKNKAIEAKYLESYEKVGQYKKIIDSEREIRRLADKKMKESIARATQAEAELLEEVKQRKLTDERAKKAVAHATKTVMQFLNASDDEVEELTSSGQLDLNKLHEKKRSKIAADIEENS